LVIAEEQSNLPQPLEITPKLEGTGEWVNTSVYIFRPKPALMTDTLYKIRIKAGLDDAFGESSLAHDYTWSFRTTVPAIDSFELSTGQVNPNDDYQNVLLDTYFTIHFLQAMDQASVESALSLTTAASQAVSFISTWNQDATTIVFTPTQILALDTSYTLTLDTAAHAQGGGALNEGLTWRFKTIPPPAVLITRPEDDSTSNYFTEEFYINFASPMRIDTVKERIVISPKPEKDIEWWYNEWDWGLSGFFLRPSTRYEILFKAGMEDIYGNATQNDTIVRFTTAARSPFAGLAMPYDASVVRAFGPAESQQFYVTHTNIHSLKLTLASLTPEQFIDFQTGRQSAYKYTPASSTVIWEKEEKSTGRLNERVVKSYPFSGNRNKSLAPGFYFLGMDTPEVDHAYSPFLDYRLVMVAGANLSFKVSSSDGLVWLTDMESGRPVPGASVTIYDKSFKPIASGQTDRDGSLHLDLPESSDPYEPRFALSTDGRAFGFAGSQWGSGVSLYDYGIWSNYYSPASQPTVYIYTERPLYRPGQPVYFKGIVRLDNDLEFQMPEVSEVNVKISSFKDTVFEEKMPLSSFGSFDGKLLLDPEAALGYYTIEVSLPGSKDVIGSLTFNVAEYRKPEFRVKLKPNETNLLAGDRFRVDLQADYYSGGGVSNAGVDWTLTSEPFYFSPPPEFSGYNFSDFNEDQYRFEEKDTSSQVVAQGSGQTDLNGRFSETLTADLSDSASSRTLTFEATVTDKATSSVSGRTSVIAHQSSIYPGIRPAGYIGKAGKEQTFNIVALDWDGKTVLGQSLQVEIVERRWYSVQEQDPSGRVTWQSTVEEIPVVEFDDVKSGPDGKAQVSFTPATGGIYKATVKALDLHGKTGKASTILWVAGDEFIPWRQTNDRSFDLVTDKKFYTPGDVAQVLIASPFEGESYALVTVERGRIRFQEVIQLTSNSTIYELPITPDLAPNAYVSVLIVKGVDDLTPRPDFKLGVREIQVDTRQRQLQVSLIPDRMTAGPGEQINYTVRTRDSNGQPVSAEVSLGLSDLATLSLLPPNSDPILDYFYAERGLGVWTAVPLSLSIDAFNADIEENLPTGEGGGSGGGKGEGEIGVIEVRQDFPDTAFWDARVLTGANGEANVVVTLPDNLTTWRMEAKAVT
ncbi:MAG: Ig-like domain-containing protein, partial [Anaerolineales bacterium]|nr:Ig-like domain-containing protein [Anaerolineales bacterium]